jgi:allophanate hydrolase
MYGVANPTYLSINSGTGPRGTHSRTHMLEAPRETIQLPDRGWDSSILATRTDTESALTITDHSCVCTGRVPAGLCGCVGVKGTLGSVSTVGVVPACASLDCLTVFARNVQDGTQLMRIMRSASASLDVWRRVPAQVCVYVFV